MILEILTHPNEILHQRCVPVRKVTKDLAEFGKDMLETVKSVNGLGLAAPQVGRTIRVIVVKVKDKYVLMYNPSIVAKSNTKRENKESCLSFPGEEYKVKRATWFKVRYLDVNNNIKMIRVDGLEAVIFSHEEAHLRGETMDTVGVKV